MLIVQFIGEYISPASIECINQKTYEVDAFLDFMINSPPISRDIAHILNPTFWWRTLHESHTQNFTTEHIVA